MKYHLLDESHACELLKIHKLRSEIQLQWVCMGKRSLTQSCVLYEVTPSKHVTSHASEPLRILKLRSETQF